MLLETEYRSIEEVELKPKIGLISELLQEEDLD